MSTLIDLELLIRSRYPIIAVETSEEQAVVSALSTAFSRSTELTTALVLEELRTTRPLSVTRKEEVDGLREWAKTRAVLAS
jgi:hypothetical protein